MKNDKGAVLELPYGIEGFAATKQLLKQDGKNAEVGESLDFKVLEFSKDDKRIVLSHIKTFTEPTEDEAKKKAKAPVTANANPTKAKAKQEPEKSTLGDIAALSALKTQYGEADEAKRKKNSKGKPEENLDEE